MTGAGDGEGPYLAFRNVGVRYGPRSALDGITFDLASGGICAVIGPNGAGKTTLLRLLAGALVPTTGRIVWSAGKRPRVALVSQAVALYLFLTPRENCWAAGRMAGVRGSVLHARTEAAVACTLCEDVRDRPVGRLSGGYQRRAAIAAALMGDAPLVVLDEPTAGLDAASVTAMAEIVLGLIAAGKTVVVSTHDFTFADAIADTILALRDGAMHAIGTPADLRWRFFAAGLHVEVVPEGILSAGQVELLNALGASPASAGRWVLFSDVDEEGRPTVIEAMRKADVAFWELRVSVPGAAALFELVRTGRARNDQDDALDLLARALARQGRVHADLRVAASAVPRLRGDFLQRARPRYQA